MEMYLGGCSGIDSPVDFDGKKIKEGDYLTFNYLDPVFSKMGMDMSRHVGVPKFIVKEHKSGKGLFAQGIKGDLYLHDFSFKYCKKVNP